MRRLLLLAAASFLLFSCATTEEPPPEEAEVEQPESAPVVEPQPEPESEPSPREPEPVEVPEAEVEAPPEPVMLELIYPPGPQVIRQRDTTIQVLSSEGTVASLQVELISGPVLAGSSLDVIVDAGDLPGDRRTARIEYRSEGVTVRLPAGLVDGEEYGYRLRGELEGGGVSEWLSLSSRLELDLPTPKLFAPRRTIDTTPVIELDGWPGEYASEVRVAAGPASRVIAVSDGRARVTEPLSPGRYTVSARGISAGGLISKYGDPVTLTIASDGTPRPYWPTVGDQTYTPRVGLQWSALVGAVGYQARYREVGDTAWQELAPTARTFVSIQDLLPVGSQFQWQVRARNDAGTYFSWSKSEEFTVGDLGISYLPVVEPGESAAVWRGYDSGSRDERPLRQITLTVPFEMSVSPITNSELATLVNAAMRRGMVWADSAGVYPTDGEPKSLLGLGALDYGEQFGLSFQAGGIVVVPGYEEHPAIGVTWYGAVALANLLSLMEGRVPAYDPSTMSMVPGSNGYRLPTEAEWEYAARGNSQRLFPWSGGLSGTVANYYRSFDPFEDVDEPFTRAGGPTNPVRFFPGDGSPFGIRDMVGNVWEWCFDRYDPGYYGESPDVDPMGPDETDFDVTAESVVLAVALDPNQRVVRGAAWNSRAPDVRLTNRGRYPEAGRSYSIGVRLVRTPIQ